MMLDATAGNRMMWGGRKAPNTIYLDKELELSNPPDIFADNTRCPFRDNVFETVIYDPPHYWNAPPWYTVPSYRSEESEYVKKGRQGPFYGDFKSKIEMLSSIHRAQKEFKRISRRLCLKWSEPRLTLWQILPLFKDWSRVQVLNIKGKRNFDKTSGTYWVTFIRQK